MSRRGIMRRIGRNLDNIKLDKERDKEELREITKTMMEIQQEIQYQKELIRKTRASLHTEKLYLRNHLTYISRIGSNYKAPKIQKNLDQVNRYESESLNTEGAIKSRLEKTDLLLAKIDGIYTSIYEIEIVGQSKKRAGEQEDNEREGNSRQESMENLNKDDRKDEVNEKPTKTVTQIAIDQRNQRTLVER